MAAAADSSSSSCASFVEETLLLPTCNVQLFAPVFALVLAHTFVFLAVAVLLAHPLASVQLDDGLYWSREAVYALSAVKIREHGAALLVLYLAYLASKLAVQSTVALAAAATLRGGSGDHRPYSLAGLLSGAPRGLFAGAALVAAVELASMAFPAACLDTWWEYSAIHSDTGGVESFVLGVLPFLFLLAVLFRLCLAAVFPVAIAAAASGEEGCDGGGGGGERALLRAWRFMTTTARRKEAALQVFVVSVVLPVATYPVYAYALECAQGRSVFMLGGQYSFLLPSAGVQLFSTVAATVFYHRCVELHPEPAIPLTLKLAKLSETLP
ncbi:unnamed protein product [Alopecurus aequalis]